MSRARRRCEVRWLAEEFGTATGSAAELQSAARPPTGWLNNASRMVAEFGPARCRIDA